MISLIEELELNSIPYTRLENGILAIDFDLVPEGVNLKEMLDRHKPEKLIQQITMKEIEAGTAYNINGEELPATWQIGDDIRIVDSDNDEICRITREDFAKIVAAI